MFFLYTSISWRVHFALLLGITVRMAAPVWFRQLLPVALCRHLARRGHRKLARPGSKRDLAPLPVPIFARRVCGVSEARREVAVLRGSDEVRHVVGLLVVSL